MDSNERLKQTWKEYKEGLASSESDGAKADDLYRKMVWPLLLEKWRHNPEIHNAERLGDVAVSLHTLGNSPEALILAALALDAERVVVLHSERTGEYLPQIEQDLGKHVEAYQVSKGDPSDIYNVAKRILDDHAGGTIAFDITSGTKAMTAGLASAGFFIQAKASEIEIDVFYVDNDNYDSSLRRPVPGSEFLVRLPSPYVVFGELQEERARVLYRNGAFKEAEAIFRRMHSEFRVGKYLNFAELAHTYARWSALDLLGAERTLQKLVAYLKSDAAYGEPLREVLPVLSQQLAGLQQMVELVNTCSGSGRQQQTCTRLLGDVERAGWLAHTLFREAERYERSENYVLGALHYYRVLELALQHRLSLRNLSPHAFSPEQLESGVLEAFKQELATIFGTSARLPQAGNGLTLLNMAALLIALNDTAIIPLGNDFRKLHGTLDARNESVLVHGLSPASKSNVKNLRSFAERIVKAIFPDLPIKEVDL